jgi:hypothetical protein
MKNFRQLWFTDQLAVEINNIEDLAKFNKLYRNLQKYCNINVKLTYDLKSTQERLRLGTIYIMLYGVFGKDLPSIFESRYYFINISEFENIFKSDLLIAKMEELITEIENNNEDTSD